MVEAVETLFDLALGDPQDKDSVDLAAHRRGRVLWRLDGGFGTDPGIFWLLERNYQLLAKGFSGRWAEKLAKQVQRWIPYGDAWLGSAESPVNYGRSIRLWVKRRLEKGQFKHSYYLTTLKVHSIRRAMQLYDWRGQAEVEQFRTDKQGLHLASRRKHLILAQQALILLTDLAHNLLADFHHRALSGTAFKGFAAKRIARDLLAIEGSLIWKNGVLTRIELNQLNPYAETLKNCLVRYFGQVE